MSAMTIETFDNQLETLIKNPPKTAERWKITPAMAEAMLKWNSRNRPPKPSRVRQYAAAMKEGRWRYTGVPVLFSRNRLLDGQNRLKAIVAANKPIEALVVFGVPDDAFHVIDVGATRTASDVFTIRNVRNAAMMAAASQWIAGYEDGQMGQASRATWLRDHGKLFERYKTFEKQGLQDSAWVGNLFHKVRLSSPSLMVALHFLCSRINRQQADDFFRKVADGIGIKGRRDPAYQLREFLIHKKVEGQALSRVALAAITIKAWNAMREGTAIKGGLTYGPDEPFPKAH